MRQKSKSCTWKPRKSRAAPADASGLEEADFDSDGSGRDQEDTELLEPSPRRVRRISAPGRQGQVGPRPRRNPFIEYDCREMNLMQERKWLQEDEIYMMERKEDLRHGAVMKTLAQRSFSTQDLYEKRTFFGNYSVKLKAKQGARHARAAANAGASKQQRPLSQDTRRKSLSNPAVGPQPNEFRTPAMTMKKLQQDLESSQRGFVQASPLEGPRGGKDLHQGILDLARRELPNAGAWKKKPT